MKIYSPNTFQTPNDLVDYWLPKLGEAEVKVLLVIFRKTFGWHKCRDRISTSQLTKLTGLTRTYVIKAAKSLAEKCIIIREVTGPEGKQETYYELVISDESNNSYQSSKETPPSLLSGPPPVCLADPQNPPIQNPLNKTTPTPKKSSSSETPVNSVGGSLKYFSFLESIPIKQEDKIRLTKKFKEETVRKAVAYCTKSSFKPQKSLDASIFYFCQNPDHMTASKEEISNQKQKEKDHQEEILLERKLLAKHIAKKAHKFWLVHIANDYIEVSNHAGDISSKVYFNSSKFISEIKNLLRKFEIDIDLKKFDKKDFP